MKCNDFLKKRHPNTIKVNPNLSVIDMKNCTKLHKGCLAGIQPEGGSDKNTFVSLK